MAEQGLSRSTRVLIGNTAVAAGIAVVFTGIFMNGFFSVCTHSVASRVLFSATGLVFIFFGTSMLLNRKLLGAMGRILAGIVITVVVLESISVVGMNIYEALNRSEQDIKKSELRLHSGIYRPFVVWRESPFHSERLNVDHNGLRIVPGADPSENSYRVFVFGGSTMFGWNTSDRNTICGHLQRLLSEKLERPVQVVNFAQQGYVNTQEMIELQLQLRSGNIPDLAIFYDGTNEIWSAIDSDTAGVHFILKEIKDLYENRNFREQQAENSVILRYVSQCNSVVLLQRVLGLGQDDSNLTLFQTEPSRCMTEGEAFVSSALYSDTIMSYYEGNLRILDALSREFNFDYLCFWQPVLVTGEKTLTEQETIIAESQSSYLVSLYEYCEEKSYSLDFEYEHFHSITNAFDNCNYQVFNDICHLNTAGDSIIAGLIFSEVEEILQ